MSRSLPKIREQLTQIESDTQECWQLLATIYQKYLQHLTQALNKKGSYAIYQICTQIYPKAFLKFNFSARQRFQAQVVQTIKEFPEVLQKEFVNNGLRLNPSSPELETEDTTEAENSVTGVEPSQAIDSPKIEVTLDDSPSSDAADGIEEEEQNTLDNDSTDATDQEQGDSENEDDDDFLPLDMIREALSDALDKDGLSLSMLIPQILQLDKTAEPLQIKTPEDLLHWHQRLEQLLKRSLVKLSMQLNRHLLEAKLVPANLPPRILEMALQSGDERLTPNQDKMPHIVNVLIETAQRDSESDSDSPSDSDEDEMKKAPRKNLSASEESEEEDRDNESEAESKVMRGEISRLTVIHFRLSDLEFSEMNLSMLRKQLRAHINDLKKVHQHYQSLDKQRLTAEAEQAWRSSWGIISES